VHDDLNDPNFNLQDYLRFSREEEIRMANERAQAEYYENMNMMQ